MSDNPDNSLDRDEKSTFETHYDLGGASTTKSRPSADSDPLEQAQCAEKVGNVTPHEQNPSMDLTKTMSNVVSRVASRMAARTSGDPPPPPDGGLKAWTQVAMGWLVIFTTWGWVNSYGAFQDYYLTSLPQSASTISWIGAVQNWATFFIGAFSGRLLDAGYFLPTLIVGSLLQILGIFMMSLSKNYWQLMITEGIMTGVGGGMFFTPAMGLMGTYFSSKRAFAIGIATTGNSVGGMIYPVLVQQLLPKLGFAWTVRVLGFLNLGLLSLVIALMRPRLPPRKSGPVIDISAFRELPYTFFVLSLFFCIWPIYYTFYYLSSFGTQTLSMPFSASTSIVIVLNGVGVPARVIPPFLADKYGQLNLVIPAVASLTIVAFAWLGVSSSGGLWAYTVFYGMTSAAFQCLFPSTVASLTPDMSMLGTRLGMAFSILSIAALTGPPLGGAIQASEGGKYLGAQLWAALSTAVCLGLVLASRTSKVGWKLGVKC